MLFLRSTREIKKGKMEEYLAVMAKVEARYAALGFESTTIRYRPFFGTESVNTMISDTKWESLSILEAAIPKLAADPEMRALRAEFGALVKSNRRELYEIL